AMGALADIGEAAVPALIEATKDPKARHWATVVLSEIGPKASAAVDALTKIAADPEPEVRLQALIALGQIGDPAKPAIPVIQKALAADELGIRYGAAFALGKLRAEEASADLQKLVDTKDPMMHLIAAWALARIHPNDVSAIRRAVDAIVKGLESDNAQLSRTAARALAEANFSPDAMTPAIRAALEELDPTVIEHVLLTLAELGDRAVPVLISAVKEPKMRDAAIRGLARIGPPAKDAVQVLTTMLTDKNPQVIADAATALASIGPGSVSATSALTALLANPDADVRGAATNALGTIGPPAKGAVPALLKQITGQDPMLCVASVWSIHRIDPENKALAPAATPVLIRILTSENPESRYQAAAALGDLGPAAKSAVSALTKLADDPDENVRRMVGAALAKIQPPRPK
ncbi:MAG TPA: HEAT repeat domain-containing protein, partial [Pirellulales bacterium]